ncbi:YHS domain-containing (seleno)protein [Yoonia sediminilitoris]|uniref:YHS domain-containing protein n=1 Tax=Yoonia sediminilitoris TaxID=1286148 RepID=A0A2T6K807_9RHOB|nr:YHS domain-containing (seleno)protein [Yoonia sediminilitoris]PUB10843.1 hypothetical protein C8N45_11615 [Yoonia sediminilitoris]RCW90518.1 hypothetical protein DFP92_11615 [Yoonia sediminilitoris]
MQFKRRDILGLGASFSVLVMVGTASNAETQPGIYAEDGVAIDGTDPVAYFTQGRPVAGDPAITHDWMGATWRFASTANKEAFVADPVAYAPQFGGYCAWAVSEGYTASTTPDAWSIVDDKLYLNYSRRIQRRWERDIPGHIEKGNANWPKVLG